MTKGDAEQVEPMKLIFNYNNVFYSFYYDRENARVKTL